MTGDRKSPVGPRAYTTYAARHATPVESHEQVLHSAVIDGLRRWRVAIRRALCEDDGINPADRVDKLTGVAHERPRRVALAHGLGHDVSPNASGRPDHENGIGFLVILGSSQSPYRYVRTSTLNASRSAMAL